MALNSEIPEYDLYVLIEGDYLTFLFELKKKMQTRFLLVIIGTVGLSSLGFAENATGMCVEPSEDSD